MEQKPSVGRIVLFRQHASNGIVEHPAIITRVWSDTCVNLTVFPDCGVPITKSSVEISDPPRVAGDDADLSLNNYAWRWPPRV